MAIILTKEFKRDRLLHTSGCISGLAYGQLRTSGLTLLVV